MIGLSRLETMIAPQRMFIHQVSEAIEQFYAFLNREATGECSSLGRQKDTFIESGTREATAIQWEINAVACHMVWKMWIGAETPKVIEDIA